MPNAPLTTFAPSRSLFRKYDSCLITCGGGTLTHPPQPQYKDLVPMFGILNEPFANTLGMDQLESLCVRHG